MALWSLKGKKILVVDDYGEMRSMLRKMLAGYGADDISAVANGEEAIDIIGSKPFDIILCDYNLGDGKDGQQVLEEVKYRGYLSYATTFIMITAESTAFMVMGALECQPDEYLSKPVTATVLQARLQKVMEKKAGLQTLAKALKDKNQSKAIALCDEQIGANPRSRFEMLKLKSELLLELKDFAAARELCQRVLSERDIPWANLALGKIHFYNNEFDAAQTIFEAIISENGAYVAAYDWLAKTLQAKDEHEAAQKTLQQAVAWSPKSVMRQRALAEVSEQNNDYAGAEEARKKTIRIGKNSVMRMASDYTKLAKTLVKNDNAKEALRYVDLIKHEFKGDAEAGLGAALTKEKIYRESGQAQKSAEAAQEALQLYAQLPSLSSSELAIELTDTCLAHGKGEEAKSVLQQLVSNHHNDEKALQQIGALYKDVGQEELAATMINQLRKQMIAINNQGVELLNNGKVDAAITLFEQALKGAANNPTLNINAAQAYLMLMKKQGKATELLEKTRRCLDMASGEEKLQQSYKVLNTLYWDIVNQ